MKRGVKDDPNLAGEWPMINGRGSRWREAGWAVVLFVCLVAALYALAQWISR